MTTWTLSLPAIERVFGATYKTDTILEQDTMIIRYFCPQNREVWHFFHQEAFIGALAFHHDDYLTYIHSIHVNSEWRQQGWSKKMFMLAEQHYGPLVHSQDRTESGRRYIKNAP